MFAASGKLDSTWVGAFFYHPHTTQPVRCVSSRIPDPGIRREPQAMGGLMKTGTGSAISFI